jgi:predicted enzyme related to lactoylglutathione lyase
MPLTLRNVTFMSDDPGRLADFWSAATGYTERRDTPSGEVLLAPDGWGFPRFTFQRVASSKGSPGPIHLDLAATDLAAEVARLLELGASRSPEKGTVTADGMTWTVLLDPDGNEFCVVQQPPGE